MCLHRPWEHVNFSSVTWAYFDQTALSEWRDLETKLSGCTDIQRVVQWLDHQKRMQAWMHQAIHSAMCISYFEVHQDSICDVA